MRHIIPAPIWYILLVPMLYASDDKETVFQILQGLHAKNQHYLFYKLDDTDALAARLVNKWFYNNLASYRENIIKRNQVLYPENTVLKAHSNPDPSEDGKLLCNTIAYGPSGNVAYLLETRANYYGKESGRIQICIPLEHDGNFSLLKKKIMCTATSMPFDLQSCTSSVSKCGLSELITCMYHQLPENKEYELYDLLLVNRATKNTEEFIIPKGATDFIFSNKSNALVIKGQTNKGKFAQDIPWEVKIFPNRKKNSLHFSTYRVQHCTMAPSIAHLFSDATLAHAQVQMPFIHKSKDKIDTEIGYPSLNPSPQTSSETEFKFFKDYFPEVIEDATLLSTIASSDFLALDAFLCAAAKNEHYMHLTDTHILAKYCIALRNLKEKKNPHNLQTTYSTDLHELYKNMLTALLLRTRIKKNERTSMFINALGLLEVPTTHIIDRTQKPACWATPRHRFLQRYVTYDFDKVEAVSNAFDKTLNNTPLLSQKVDRTLQHACTLEYFTRSIAIIYADSMWDNGSIGATWQFNERDMEVALYDFNAEKNNEIAIYTIPDITSGAITHIDYKHGNEPIFFVNDKRVHAIAKN